jgi:hypothetical protein
MSSPVAMGLYNGHQRIGEIKEIAPGRILAIDISANGRRVDLGYFPTRHEAMQAISAQHTGGPEPPSAA